MTRPRVAVLATVYFPESHGDVVGTRLIEGYEWDGGHTQSRVDVASVYLEQIGTRAHPDMGVEITDRHGIPRFPSAAEAIGLGRTGVNVDGVVIIGEHGDYEFNEFGQKLYPRRRLFDIAVAAMVAAGRIVPIFVDKHLSWAFPDARAMVADAHRLGIPILAGSSIPLTWRIPTGSEWPAGEPLTDIVAVACGPTEDYGFHALEAIQSFAERRAGGESGVRSVSAFTGPAAIAVIESGTVDADLLTAALATYRLSSDQELQARHSVKDVFLVEYIDGLRTAVVNCDEIIDTFALASRGGGREVSCRFWQQDAPFGHFTFLVRQIEALMINGAAPYPVERTLLTGGILDAAMQSRAAHGVRLVTPELAIAYTAVPAVNDTAVAFAPGDFSRRPRAPESAGDL